MAILIWIVLSAVAVYVTSYVLPGIHLKNFGAAIVVAVILGIINGFLAPILYVLTLPINILTLGLFTFVVMALLVMLTGAIVPGFVVDGFWWALAFALIFALLNMFFAGVL